jgi:hypothetical protein
LVGTIVWTTGIRAWVDGRILNKERGIDAIPDLPWQIEEANFRHGNPWGREAFAGDTKGREAGFDET